MALIADLRHFLDENGNMPEMPKPARILAEYLGRIVRGVTSRQEGELATGVKCRKRVQRRRCPGEIIAFIDEREAICWACPVCGKNGIISGWEGSIWDWWVNA